MTQVSPTTMQPTSSISPSQRPKGILKNSFRGLPRTRPSIPLTTSSTEQAISTSPMPTINPESEKDITLQNTLQNAGHRRESSQNHRASISRRQSSNPNFNENAEAGENVRLKWDEANLYLTEQEKSSTMRIDEPKTPYAKRYDPEEDDEEMRTLDVQDLQVDELDKLREGRPARRTREAEIPGLDIGEPEEDVSYVGRDEADRIQRSESGSRWGRSGSVKGEKTVVVDPEAPDGKGHDGTVRHRDFEEMRKKHYEMKDVKGLLGHSAEELEAMDEDDDGPPAMPKLNDTMVNGA